MNKRFVGVLVFAAFVALAVSWLFTDALKNNARTAGSGADY